MVAGVQHQERQKNRHNNLGHHLQGWRRARSRYQGNLWPNCGGQELRKDPLPGTKYLLLRRWHVGRLRECDGDDELKPHPPSPKHGYSMFGSRVQARRGCRRWACVFCVGDALANIKIKWLTAVCLGLTVDATRFLVSAGRECRVTTAVTMLAQYLFRYQVS